MTDVGADGAGTIEIHHRPEDGRYELRDGDRVIGLLAYTRPDEGHVDVLHTEVDEEYAGQGLAGRLVAHVLADARGHGLRVIPHCPYVQTWLRRNPGYQDLVDWPHDA